MSTCHHRANANTEERNLTLTLLPPQKITVVPPWTESRVDSSNHFPFRACTLQILASIFVIYGLSVTLLNTIQKANAIIFHAYGPADVIATPSSLLQKIQNGLSFWYQPTRVVPEQRLLNDFLFLLSQQENNLSNNCQV